MKTLVIIPTFLGGREHRGRARPGAAPPPPGGHPRGGRLSPDGTAELARAAARSWADRRADPARQGRPGGAYCAGFQRAFAAATRSSCRWTPTCPTCPTGSRPCSPRSTRGPTSPSVPATPRAAPPPTGRWCGSCCPGRQLLRLERARPRCAGRYGRVPGLPGRHPGDGRGQRHQGRRPRGSSWSCRTGHTGSAYVVEVPITFSDRFRGVFQDVLAHHRRGHVAGDVVGPRDRVLRRAAATGPGPRGARDHGHRARYWRRRPGPRGGRAGRPRPCPEPRSVRPGPAVVAQQAGGAGHPGHDQGP